MTIYVDVPERDATPIQLPSGLVSQLNEELRSLKMGVGFLESLIKDNALEVASLRTATNSIGVACAVIHRLLNVPAMSTDERTAHQFALKEANERIAELQTHLSAKVSAEHLSAAMAHLAEVINDWWSAAFCSTFADVRWDGRSLALKLDCQPRSESLAFMLDPESSKELFSRQIQVLENANVSLIKGRQYLLLDTPETRAHLMAIVLAKLPQARLTDIESRGLFGNEMKAYIALGGDPCKGPSLLSKMTFHIGRLDHAINAFL